MLQQIRELATGWLAGIIVTLLILSFALWGVGSYFSEGTEPFVAKVNDTEIKQTQFQRALYNLREQMQKLMGTQVDAEDPMLKKETVDRLIDSEVINQIIQDAGLRVADNKVVETINEIDMFRNNSGFDQSIYQRSVNALGMDPTVFEQQVRLDMLSEQLQSAVSESSFTTESEIENLVRLKKQQRNFSYVSVPVREIRKSIETNDEEIQAYYDKHKNEFLRPKQVRIQYIDLTLDKVVEQIEVNDDELEAYFSSNQQAYNKPEKRKLWQIKIAKPKNANEEELEKSQAKADELLAIAKGNESFEKIAETYSSSGDDKVKVDVSESGFMEQGKLPDSVDEAVFAMDKGAISDPIETDDAIFIVKLEDIQQAREVTFAEAKEDAAKDLRKELAEKRYFDLADELQNLSYEHQDTLQVASDAIDIPIEESELFTQAVPGKGVISFTRVRDSSFSEQVLLEGNNSDALEISDERIIVLRVIEQVEAGEKPLSEVKEEVSNQVIEDKARLKANEIGQTLLKQAEEGQPLDALLSEHKLELKEASAITRNDISVSRSILRTAFRMEKPEDGKNKIEGTQMGNGDYALVLLEKVSYPEKIQGKDISDQETAMQRIRADSDWDGFFEQAKNTSDIQIVESNL